MGVLGLWLLALAFFATGIWEHSQTGEFTLLVATNMIACLIYSVGAILKYDICYPRD